MLVSHEFSAYAEEFQAAPGVVIVQMARRTSGLILMPGDGEPLDEIAKVLALGPRFQGIYLGRECVSDPVKSLRIGDTVLVRPDRGLELDGFGWHSAGDEVIRVYGSNGGPGSFVPFQRYAYDEAVMAVIKSGIRAVGKRLILQLGPRETMRGGVHLPAAEQWRDPVCEVLSVGAEVVGYEPGDKVIVSQNAIYEFGDEVKREDIGSVHQDAILAKL